MYDAEQPGGFARKVATCLAFGVSGDLHAEATPMVAETARTAATTSPLNGLGHLREAVSGVVDLRSASTNQVLAWLGQMDALRQAMEAAA